MKKLLFLVFLLSNFFGFAQYTLIPDVNFEKALIEKGFDSGAIDGRVLTANVSGVTVLNITSRNISDLTGIQAFLALSQLRCNYNQLTNLDVTKNIALTGLFCENNQLTNLDVTKNTALTNLVCVFNSLLSLDVTKNTALIELLCYANQLTNLDVSKNIALTHLLCWSNQITNLDVSKNTVLNVLYCSSNQLTNLDVTKNIALIDLACSNNQLSSLNLKNGNNIGIYNVSLNLKPNPKLTCIEVDNKIYSDTNWSSKKDATASFSENCSKTAAIAPPVITATGNQTYCPNTSIKIVTGVTITHDPSETETDAIYIQISSGYIEGQDKLDLVGLHPNITWTWLPKEGKLELRSISGKIPYTDFEAAIKDVTYTNSSAFPTGTRDFSINLGFDSVSYLPRNGHFYKYVSSPGITWTAAKTLAEASSNNYYGLQGYLATLTAPDESQLAGAQAQGAGWIGGSDAATEGTWKWVTGPEGIENGGTGRTFWMGTGDTGSFTFPDFYANWNRLDTNNKEPNNKENEDFAHITASSIGNPGTWNDLSNTGSASGDYQPKGYIVEYGGMIPNDVDNIKISASTKISIPNITSTTPNSICGSGSLTLQATASVGAVDWYNTPTGGTALFTGNSFTTPNLTTTTSYYVDASNGGCPNGPRTEIIATVNVIPTITSTAPTSRCDSGTVTLGATASAGMINWYNVATGGTSVGTGTSFTTQTISATTNYYVDATANGCTSPTRALVTATVNTTPAITSARGATRCDSGSVTLNATASVGTINWYDAPTGGVLVNAGTSFSTPILTTTTTYYVEATTTFCTSPRTAIIATINAIPRITSNTTGSRCDAGTVTLGATASAGMINWYDAPIGGILVNTGTSFTTPTITSTTKYYIDATANGCTSPTRTLIVASVDTTPTITSTQGATRCDSGSVTLDATASAGTINWYDVISGGVPIATGNSFITPSLSSTTTYFVDTTDNQCISPRLSVVASVYPVVNTTQEVVLCQSKMMILDASIQGMNYLWSPGGETSQTIIVSSIGDYTVTISSPLILCDSKKMFNVIEHPKPIFKEIVVEENSITIELEDSKNYYEFSIDGELFVDFNQFSRIPSGQYTAFVREKNGCNLVQQDFTIFTISKFFTPNGDSYNDVWEIKGMSKYPQAEVQLFDRYGKYIITLNASNKSWNGTLNGSPLPASDYWYILNLRNGQPEIKGHFALKR